MFHICILSLLHTQFCFCRQNKIPSTVKVIKWVKQDTNDPETSRIHKLKNWPTSEDLSADVDQTYCNSRLWICRPNHGRTRDWAIPFHTLSQAILLTCLCISVSGCRSLSGRPSRTENHTVAMGVEGGSDTVLSDWQKSKVTWHFTPASNHSSPLNTFHLT